MSKKLKKFYISGMAWIPSYRDFDQYDTTVDANNKEHALEVFGKTSMSKFMKYEPCVQTEKEWTDMFKRLETMNTVCPPPSKALSPNGSSIEIPSSKELDNEWANESI